MNETDRGKLLRDVRASGMAARKRQRRKLTVLAASSCGVAACLLLAMRVHSPGEPPPRSHEIVEVPAATPSANPAIEALPTAIQAESEKDEALLNTLSDAGPVIITMADGSRQLYLTRP